MYGQNPEITEAILPEIRRMGVTGQLHCTVINQLNNPVSYYYHNLNPLILYFLCCFIQFVRHNFEILEGFID